MALRVGPKPDLMLAVTDRSVYQVQYLNFWKVDCTLYTGRLILRGMNIEERGTMHNAQCTMHNAQCTMHNAQCTMHNAQCTMHNAQCTMHNAQCTMHNAQCTMHNAQCTMHNAQSINCAKINVPSILRIRKEGQKNSLDIMLTETLTATVVLMSLSKTLYHNCFSPPRSKWVPVRAELVD